MSTSRAFLLFVLFSVLTPPPPPTLLRHVTAAPAAVKGLANHTASHTLASAIKTVGSHDTGRVLDATIKRLNQELDTLEDARKAVVAAGVSNIYHPPPSPPKMKSFDSAIHMQQSAHKVSKPASQAFLTVVYRL